MSSREVKTMVMPENLPSSIWSKAWATLYSIYGQRLQQDELDLMDSVLQSIEEDARAKLRRIKDINEGEC